MLSKKLQWKLRKLLSWSLSYCVVPRNDQNPRKSNESMYKLTGQREQRDRQTDAERERERERERETDRETEREKQRQRKRDRQTDRHTEIGTKRLGEIH